MKWVMQVYGHDGRAERPGTDTKGLGRGVSTASDLGSILSELGRLKRSEGLRAGLTAGPAMLGFELDSTTVSSLCTPGVFVA